MHFTPVLFSDTVHRKIAAGWNLAYFVVYCYYTGNKYHASSKKLWLIKSG